METEPISSDVQPSAEKSIENAECSFDDKLKDCSANPEDEVTILSPGRAKLHSWLYKLFRIVLTDGRVLSGAFLCTDSDANIILGMCSEDTQKGGEERMLGLVMVPGRHIVSMEMDTSFQHQYPTPPN